jgi:hypothetical protein
MSIRHQYIEQTIHLTMEGVLSRKELYEYLKQISGEDGFKRSKYILLHDAHSFYTPSVADMKITAENFREGFAGFKGKIALVVHSAVKYGMGRMLESLSSDKDFRVFRSEEEAREWLRITD